MFSRSSRRRIVSLQYRHIKQNRKTTKRPNQSPDYQTRSRIQRKKGHSIPKNNWNETNPPTNSSRGKREGRTCWKLLTVFPKLRPISGSFFGPKTSAVTPAITTSSGTPRPNMQRHPRPRWRRRRGWGPNASVDRARATLSPPPAKNAELGEPREKAFIGSRVVLAIRDAEEKVMAAVSLRMCSLARLDRNPLTFSRCLLFLSQPLAYFLTWGY